MIGRMTIRTVKTVQCAMGADGGTIAVTAPYWREHTLAITPGAVTTDGFDYGNPSWWLGGDSELPYNGIDARQDWGIL